MDTLKAFFVFALVLYLVRSLSQSSALRPQSRVGHYRASGMYESTWQARREAIIGEAEARHEGFLTRSAFRRACSKTTVYARDNGICGICGRPVAWFDSQVDHIIPLARGGAHDPRNLQIAHASCNALKGAKRR